jgi:hypothetical protein
VCSIPAGVSNTRPIALSSSVTYDDSGSCSINLDSQYFSDKVDNVELEMLSRLPPRQKFLPSTLGDLLAHIPPEVIVSLSIRDCFLHDEDLLILPDLLGRVPNCKALDLSNNIRLGLGKGATSIASILFATQTSGCIVNVIGTRGLASVDNKQLYTNLQAEDVARLIWMPQAWLNHAADVEEMCKLLFFGRPDLKDVYKAVSRGHSVFHGRTDHAPKSELHAS